MPPSKIYFVCIFCCDNQLCTKDEMKHHYLNHFSESHFCENLDDVCDCEALNPLATVNSDEIGENINVWIENFLLMQESNFKREKHPLYYSVPNRRNNCNLMPGCVLCDLAATLPENASRELDDENFASRKHAMRRALGRTHATDGEEMVVSLDLWMHVVRHMKYFRYKCSQCPEKGYKHTFKEVFDHAKVEHGNVNSYVDIYPSTRSLIIPMIENYLTVYMKRAVNILWIEEVVVSQLLAAFPQFAKNAGNCLNNQVAKRTTRLDSKNENGDSDNVHAPSTTPRKPPSQPARKDPPSTQDLKQLHDIKESQVVAPKLTYLQIKNTLNPEQVMVLSSNESRVLLMRQNIVDNCSATRGTYYCPFCNSSHDTRDDIRKCCRPITCCHCQAKFISKNMFASHSNKQHPNTSATYIHHEDKEFSKWLEHFLDVQEAGEDIVELATREYFCGVCDHVNKNADAEYHEQTWAKDHLVYHLFYTPYQCRLCQDGERTCFATKAAAVEHISARHPLIQLPKKEPSQFENSELEEFFKIRFQSTLIEDYIEKMKREHIFLKKLLKPRRARMPEDDEPNENAKKKRKGKVMDMDVETKRRNKQAKNSPLRVKQHEFMQPPYACIFCDDKFDDMNRLYLHCCEHINAKPFLCKLCPGIECNANDAVLHHRLAHSGSAVEVVNNLYNIEVAWLLMFLSRAYKDESTVAVEMCPVCDKLRADSPKVKLNAVTLEDHIRDHLSYFGKACRFCTTTQYNYFSDEHAAIHLRNVHNLDQDASPAWKLYSIPLLDELIRHSLSRDPHSDLHSLLQQHDGEVVDRDCITVEVA